MIKSKDCPNERIISSHHAVLKSLSKGVAVLSGLPIPVSWILRNKSEHKFIRLKHIQLIITKQNACIDSYFMEI